jgi:hypothetical protein
MSAGNPSPISEKVSESADMPAPMSIYALKLLINLPEFGPL